MWTTPGETRGVVLTVRLKCVIYAAQAASGA